MKKIKSIEILINNYINGSLTDTEEEQLYNWLMESSENKSFFKEKVDSKLPDIKNTERFQSALNEARLRLFGKKQDSSRQKKIIPIKLQNWIQVAAILLVGVLLKVTLDYFVQNKMTNDSQFCKIEAPLGQKSKVTLPDGSLVWLNSDSHILFANNFRKNRTVKLEGEAYFEVQKDKKHEFKVVTQDYNVVVHGTSFNVMAYSDFAYKQTTLVEGKVEVRKDAQQIFIEPGEQLILINGEFSKKQINAEQVAAWKDNKFYFDSVSFEELIRRLERWYDVDISVQNNDLLSQKFSGVFKNEETIWQVLNALQYYIDFDYEHDNLRKFSIK